MNVQINPYSNMTPNISVTGLKGFLSRDYKICSKRYIAKISIFNQRIVTKNGHERKLSKN